MYTAYFDASVQYNRKRASIGHVIITANQRLFRHYGNSIPYVDDVQKAEAYSLWQCMYFMLTHHITPAVIYGDAKFLIDAVNQGDTSKRYYRKCIELLGQLEDTRLIWVPREENQYADWLTKVAHTGLVKDNGGKIEIG